MINKQFYTKSLRPLVTFGHYQENVPKSFSWDYNYGILQSIDKLIIDWQKYLIPADSSISANNHIEIVFVDKLLHYHREDGPACIVMSSTTRLYSIQIEMTYCLNNKIYRKDGPAYVMYCNNKLSYMEYRCIVNGLSLMLKTYRFDWKSVSVSDYETANIVPGTNNCYKYYTFYHDGTPDDVVAFLKRENINVNPCLL